MLIYAGYYNKLGSVQELQRLDKHDRDSFNISSSHFDIPHLPEALELVRLNIPNSEPIVKLPK